MKKTRELCRGCREDFYNGNNDLGVKECWSFRGARVVERMRVGAWESPPYKWTPQTTLHCHSPEGGVMITRKDPRIVLETTP